MGALVFAGCENEPKPPPPPPPPAACVSTFNREGIDGGAEARTYLLGTFHGNESTRRALRPDPEAAQALGTTNPICVVALRRLGGSNDEAIIVVERASLITHREQIPPEAGELLGDEHASDNVTIDENGQLAEIKK
jgi:hypothetical protein